MDLVIKKQTIKTFIKIFLVIVALLGLQYTLKKMRDKGEIEGVSNREIVLQEKDIKIQVVHFHGKHQCWSCITVGEYADKTIKERFPSEYESGLIDYSDIDIDLLENREITERFGASGSSLYINVIQDGRDNIQEDTNVWRLVTDEQEFINYFESRIKSILEE